MAFSLSGSEKDQLVVSLAALVLHDGEADVTAESLEAVVGASGNKVPAYYYNLFSSYIEKAGGVKKFLGSGPSAGGAAPAGAAPAAAAAAPAAAPAKKEEVVDALEGGMSMFGGGGGGGDY